MNVFPEQIAIFYFNFGSVEVEYGTDRMAPKSIAKKKKRMAPKSNTWTCGCVLTGKYDPQ